ncbi:uncharacterized protein LY89DRAFT_596884 [Mollisia scopiformis]|uniref:Zn(2)-C6 fungal-type domain-containing protein n=1 Tax=Mollisia scopiformis TaxID=149040 RepID=A0A132BBW3_MOLSC|nr:uncharacterized protein LY89DRAFT_596884 [Mollisia scopiformis]KUJ09905.1 hypothetical protein LY89DRAFT_596884 [Mollisia scopiformis]
MKSGFPRKRAVQACRMCRHRRTKCDNARPSCSMCLTLEVECVYGDKNDSLDPGSLAILKRLDGLEQLIRASKTEDLSITPGGGGPSSRESSSKFGNSPSNLNYPAPRHLADTAEYRYHVNVESMLQWPVFENQNIDQRANLKCLFHPMGEINRELQWSPSDPDLQTEEVDNALHSFFDHVHIFNPIFEEMKLTEQLQNVRLNGLGWNPESCLILLTCAVGLVSCSQEMDPADSSMMFRRSETFQLAESFFFSAQKRMGPLLTERTAIGAQCFYMAGYYLATTMRPLEAWKLLNQSLSCCQTHRRWDSTATEDEQRRSRLQQRTYWATFKSELEICLELDLAQDSINNLAYPTFFPSPPECLETELRVGWYFYLSDIAIRRLKNRCLNYIYQCERSQTSTADMVEEIINLEKEAEELSTMLPAELRGGTQDIEDQFHYPRSTIAKMRVELQMHLLDCYEIMYWPFAVNIISRHVKDDSTCLSFASKALAICTDRITKSQTRYRQRQYGSWLILRRSTRSALLLLAANLTPGLRQILPPQWKGSVFIVIEMLRYWAEELNDASHRLTILETLLRNIETSRTTSAMEI